MGGKGGKDTSKIWIVRFQNGGEAKSTRGRTGCIYINERGEWQAIDYGGLELGYGMPEILSMVSGRGSTVF